MLIVLKFNMFLDTNISKRRLKIVFMLKWDSELLIMSESQWGFTMGKW